MSSSSSTSTTIVTPSTSLCLLASSCRPSFVHDDKQLEQYDNATLERIVDHVNAHPTIFLLLKQLIEKKECH
jgi:hypothetical protein